MKSFYALLMFSCVSVLLTRCSSIPKGAVAVKPFDQQKYLGKWYEIARLDYKYERDLDNVTAEYALKENGMISVTNQGYNCSNSEWEKSVGKAKPVSDPREGRLKVSFFGPFYAGYNVIAIEGDYEYALVAGKSSRYLWLLSRQTIMPDDIKKKFLDQAESLGYITHNLLWVKQNKNTDSQLSNN